MTLQDAILAANEASVRKMIPFYIGTEELDRGLHTAVMVGMPDMAALLLKAGADPDVRTPPRDREAEAASLRYLSPQEQARLDAEWKEYRKANPRDEYSEYADLLTLILDPDTNDADLATPLIHLSESSFYILDPAIMRGDAEYDSSQRLLWLDRAQTLQSELMEHLLAAGADVHARDTVGRTALLAAASADPVGIKLMCHDGYYLLGSLEPLPTIQRLLAAGADVNARDAGGNSSLLLMAGGESTTVQLLLEAGATVNYQNRHGYSPLQRAASGANPETIRILLAAGADVDVRDKHEFTPLHHLVHWAPSKTSSSCAASLASVQTLLEAGADPNARGTRGRTPLHIAAAEGAVSDLVSTLLDAGAVKDAVDELGTTPYDLAVRMGSAHLIAVLRG